MSIDNDGSASNNQQSFHDDNQESMATPESATSNDGAMTKILTDDQLVDKAIEEIRSVYQESAWEMYIKVGEIVISMVQESKKIQPPEGGVTVSNEDTVTQNVSATKCECFKRLQKRIDTHEEGQYLPKKTFLYNAVRLVEEQKRLSSIEGYDSLSVSHKIVLLTVPEDKLDGIIKRVVKKRLSVTKTKELIRGYNSSRGKTLNYYINNPSELKEIEKFVGGYSSKLSKNTKTKEKAIEGCKTKLDELESEINDLQLHKEKIETLLNKISEIKIEPKNTRRKGKTEALPDA